VANRSAEHGDIIELLPLHLAPDHPGRRPRGRPQSVDPAPTQDALEYHAAVLRERQLVTDQDPLVDALRGRRSAADIVRRVVETLAHDAAVLGHVRDEMAKRGKNAEVAQATSRRAALLERVAALAVELGRLEASPIDPHCEPIQRAFGMLVQDFVDVARAVLSDQPALLDAYLEATARRIEGWEARIEAVLR
jgi:hypothetical protein